MKNILLKYFFVSFILLQACGATHRCLVQKPCSLFFSPGQGFTWHSIPLRNKLSAAPLLMHNLLPLSPAWCLLSIPPNEPWFFWVGVLSIQSMYFSAVTRRIREGIGNHDEYIGKVSNIRLVPPLLPCGNISVFQFFVVLSYNQWSRQKSDGDSAVSSQFVIAGMIFHPSRVKSELFHK